MLDLVLMLFAVAGIYASFIVAAALSKRGRRLLATFSPLFVFLPIALICLGQIQNMDLADAGVLVAFAFALSFVIWLHQRRE